MAEQALVGGDAYPGTLDLTVARLAPQLPGEFTDLGQGLGRGLNRRRAVRSMAHRLGLAVGLTFITSYIGFLAVGANPISLVREFGLVASTGLAINFFLTALLVPVLLGIFGEQTNPHRPWDATNLLVRSPPRVGSEHPALARKGQ